MARGRKAGFRYYVYMFSENGEVVYVGKGTGRRFHNQAKRFKCSGEIVRWFASERAAYNFEARLIKKLCPRENIAAGGGGAVSSAKSALPVWFRKELRKIEELGSRRYLALELLKLDLSIVLPLSKVEQIRRVAHG